MLDPVIAKDLPAPSSTAPKGLVGNKLDWILLGLALAAMFLPTYQMLANEFWNQEGQGHGPVMLALTGWLFYKRWPDALAVSNGGSPLLGGIVFLIGLVLYSVGRSQSFPEFEVLAQIPLLAGLLIAYLGVRSTKALWFPLFFILFIVPLPGSLVQAMTAPLKSAVSWVADYLLHAAGYPIARSGVTLTIGQYKLLVADACAGLNSIFSLEAIGVFYLSVTNYASASRKLLLATLILPISFVSNVTRVITLVLITYYFGDEAGQGFVHGFAGILLFSIATLLTIGTDGLLGRLFFNQTARPAQT
jgi:exosortase B